jgi:hypothetical protein
MEPVTNEFGEEQPFLPFPYTVEVIIGPSYIMDVSEEQLSLPFPITEDDHRQARLAFGGHHD